MHITEENQEREDRIEDEVVVDAYGPYERASGWSCYLTDKIEFPFEATCIKKIGKSPLTDGEKVTVLEIGDEDLTGIYVKVEWNSRKFEVPLEQLKALNVDEHTLEAVEDWHYWVYRGYQF